MLAPRAAGAASVSRGSNNAEPLGVRQRILVERVELVQRSIDGLAQRLRLLERDRTHTRNVSTPTDRSVLKPADNAIQAQLSTTPNPSTDFDRTPNQP